MKKQTISIIENRIKSEYRKHHPNKNWAKIAAIKIHDELQHHLINLINRL